LPLKIYNITIFFLVGGSTFFEEKIFVFDVMANFYGCSPRKLDKDICKLGFETSLKIRHVHIMYFTVNKLGRFGKLLLRAKGYKFGEYSLVIREQTGLLNTKNEIRDHIL